MDIYDVIIRPIISEKSTRLVDGHNQFTFEVNMNANKIQIKEAVERIFDVDVINVTTSILPLKRGQRGRKTYQRTPAAKKAIVTLPSGQMIGLFKT
ncbi:MAG: 50S ribosomal protein L23 [Aggregatilineales bacterium]